LVLVHGEDLEEARERVAVALDLDARDFSWTAAAVLDMLRA
jgi:hypothetical protein